MRHFPVAIVSLCVGLLMQGPSRDSQPAPKIDEPLSVSFCSLLREPERYNGMLVRTKAVLHRDQKPFIYDWSCKSTNSYSMTPLVRVVDDFRTLLPAWADDSSYCASGKRAEETGLAAEVVIVGTFWADYLTPKTAPAFKIVPQSIQQISPASRRP